MGPGNYVSEGLASFENMFLKFFHVLLYLQLFLDTLGTERKPHTHTHTYTYNGMRGAPPIKSTDIDMHQIRNLAFLDREKEGRRERNTVFIEATGRAA